MRSGVLSWGFIHSHINTCLRKHIMIDPWKEIRSNRCMVFKMIPLLQIKKAKMIRLKSQFSEIFSLQLKKWCWRNKSSKQKGYQNNKYQHGSSLSMIFIRKQSCPSHKRKLWMEEPIPNSQSKRKTQNTFLVIKKASNECL